MSLLRSDPRHVLMSSLHEHADHANVHPFEDAAVLQMHSDLISPFCGLTLTGLKTISLI